MKKKSGSGRNKKSHRTRKAVFWILLGFFLVIAAGVLFLMTNLNFIVKSAIQKYGSEAVQTAVRVDRVNISLKQGSGAIHGLTIANPSGFSFPFAFSLGKILLDIDIQSITGEVKIIDDITVEAPEVFVEMNQDRRVNLNEIKKALVRQAPSKTKQPAAGKTGQKPKLIIRHLRFAEGIIHTKLAPQGGKEQKLRLPVLEMRNIGGRSGAYPDQIARQILNELTRHAMNEVTRRGINLAADKAKEKARSALDEQKRNAGNKVKGLLK
ncbi:hypothetical protein JW906_02205 [bacterium]|nr:hypothetical protein [bacterium]